MRCHNHTQSFEKLKPELEKNSRDENLIISDKSTSDDDEDTVVGKEGVEVHEEAENVSKGTRNDDEINVNTHIVIFTV